MSSDDRPTPGPRTQPPGATRLVGSAAALARGMVASLGVPTATTVRTFDVAVLDRRRPGLLRHGAPVSSSRLIAWAVVRASRAVPSVTHRYALVDERPHRVVDEGTHLGLAVDVEREPGVRTVLVPVIPSADTLDFARFCDAYDERVGAARAGTLQVSDLHGANLVLTNTAAFGSTTGVARLPLGASAIVAVGAITHPPGLRRLALEHAVDRVVTLSCTYDHRVVQGADSGAFLAAVQQDLDSEELYDEAAASLGVPAERPEPAAPPSPAARPAGAPATLRAQRMIDAVRRDGHTVADLDPLGRPDAGPAPGLPGGELDADLAAVPVADLDTEVAGSTFGEVWERIRAAYCGRSSLEAFHLSSAPERRWLQARVERGDLVPAGDDARRWAHDLVRYEGLELFLQRTYLGHKTLSVEGLDTTTLVTEELVRCAAADHVDRVTIAMAHRGRLGVLVHVCDLPYADLMGQFEAASRTDAVRPVGLTGDVVQHLGGRARRVFAAADGGEDGIDVELVPNPSHLEAVSPVALGVARAHADAGHDVLPVLLHGDAAFTGQGVVAETLNLHALAGYGVGGAVHVLQDNGLGFTTDGTSGRSTRWPSDPAKGFDLPVLHVNADDVLECVHAARLAFAFRREFGRDVLIHVVGYRRLGHSETDEPRYTQPVLYQRVDAHPRVADGFAAALVGAEQLARWRAEVLAELQQAHARAATTSVPPATPQPREDLPDVVTGVDQGELERLAQLVTHVPPGFAPHPKVAAVLARRSDVAAGVDWASAELLAFAVSLQRGQHVRFTGQDSLRGTFSQRHLELVDVRTGTSHRPLGDAAGLPGCLHAYNSPLSEAAVLGFEYGYSLADPDALTVWEAQFGDFANAAQVVLDQFVAGGHAKWGVHSRLVLLLPHGFEGGGPEHSSARPERFLQLCAEGNLGVAAPTTAAQYFHLLRRQALAVRPAPLVVLTPKSLLRAAATRSAVGQLGPAHHFRPLLPGEAPRQVRRVVLASGKLGVQAALEAGRAGPGTVLVATVEQLAPWPSRQVAALLRAHPGAEVVWAQEEPANMGAWTYVAPRLRAAAGGREVRYVGRPERAAVAEGHPSDHAVTQQQLLADVVAPVPT